MSRLPKTAMKRHARGSVDHVDAWLMSYADLITLLFMFFVIFVAVSYSKRDDASSLARGEPEHPVVEQKSGMLALESPFEKDYRALEGLVADNDADQDIAVEKTTHGLLIDVAAPLFFPEGSADIRESHLEMIGAIARVLRKAPADAIEVEGYTDDDPPQNSIFANNWELSAMRAARVVTVLVNQGIEPTLLHASGYAGDHPVVPNADVAGQPIFKNQARNQRIVIRLEKAPSYSAPKVTVTERPAS